MSIDLDHLADLTDAQVADAFLRITTEHDRRTLISSARDQQANLNREVLSAEGRKSGDLWVQPAGAHDAYPKGWEATDDKGAVYVSLIDANVLPLGSAGWRVKLADGQVPEWVQPLGTVGAYAKGDHVMHSGGEWVSQVDANGWEPGAQGVGDTIWKKKTVPVPPTRPSAPQSWAAGVAYKTGDLVTDGGATYSCLQAHTSQAGWEPHVVASLWAKQA